MRTVLAAAVATCTVALSGCWKDELAEIPPDVLQFQPEGGDAPLGWLVEPIEVNLECPDGNKARFYLLYPSDQAGAELPVAIMLHSGSFDFVFAPDPKDPLTGTHFADPNRLTTEWAFRQVFVTLGMYPEQDDTEVHEGLLPTAFAEEGIAVMMPANCWGDLWSNKRGSSDADFAQDFFFREGLASVEWSYRMLTEPLFAAAFDVEMPITAVPTEIYGVGLAEGGRGILGLQSIDNDEDGLPDYPLAAAIVDSTPDDLRIYLDDPGLYGSRVEGLERIFPAGIGATTSGSVWGGVLPERFGYLYSSADPQTLGDLHSAALDRLATMPSAWVEDRATPQHVVLNGTSDLGLARSAVQFLRTGTKP